MIGRVKANEAVNTLHRLFQIFKLFQKFKPNEVLSIKLNGVLSDLLSQMKKFMIFGMSRNEILI